MVDLSKNNPSPFKQPFLELTLAGGHIGEFSPSGSHLLIDVGGEIDKYIASDHEPTELFVELCENLANAGVVVTEYARYTGSGGASAMLRNGALFHRMGNFEQPPEEVLAYQYRKPKYRGPK